MPVHYRIDPANSNISFEVTHLMWSTVKGAFSNFSAIVHLVPPSVGGSSENSWSFEEGSQLNIAVSSLSTDMGSLADGRVTSTMEADKYPWMSCSLEGPIVQKGKTLVANGRVTIREASQVVPFRVEVDPACKLGDERLKLVVKASMDRYELDVCPSWPTAALARELKMTAFLVFIADDRSHGNPSQDAEPVLEAAPGSSAPEPPVEVSATVDVDANVDLSAAKPQQELEQDAEPVPEVAPGTSEPEPPVEVCAKADVDANIDPVVERPQQESEQDVVPVLEAAPKACSNGAEVTTGGEAVGSVAP